MENVVSKIPVAVAGVGLHGENHVLAAIGSPIVELVMIYDTDAKRAQHIAQKYGCQATTEIETLLQSDVVAVSVATPDHLHYEVTRALLEAGKHVLVEKPLTTSIAEAEALVRLSRKKSVTLSINFANRWNPRFVAVKEVLERGSIGQPLFGYSRISNSRTVPLNMLRWSVKSGPEWFLLPHMVDVVCWLLGERPLEIYASAFSGELKRVGIDVWDGVQVMAKFSKSVVTFETCWVLPERSRSVTDSWLEITGTAGRVRAENTYQGVELEASEGLVYPGTVSLGQRNYYGHITGHYFEAIQDFFGSIAQAHVPHVRAEDGWAVTKIIAAIHESAAQKKPIQLGWKEMV